MGSIPKETLKQNKIEISTFIGEENAIRPPAFTQATERLRRSNPGLFDYVHCGRTSVEGAEIASTFR
ncbi:hypothetical protein OAL09_11645 [Verrucomicrobia bacterium]|nr:hypothetical protein [Verrucomicrobiota bacterium]